MDWKDTLEPNVRNFLNKVEEDCKAFEVDLKIHHDFHVDAGGIPCGGYFDSESLELAISILDHHDPMRWLGLLAHEWCHMHQWHSDDPSWTGCYVGDYDACMIFDMWLVGVIELSEAQLEDYINKLITVELDCERKVVQAIKDYDLPLDPGMYTRSANAYVRSYKYIHKYRKWNKPGIAPSSIPETIALMSDSFDYDYYAPLEPELEEAFHKSF